MVIDPEESEIQALISRLPAVGTCRVVEIGCGDGRLTRRYSRRVQSVYAFDSSEASVASFVAAGVDANVQVRVASIDHVELPEASVDAVLFSWAL